MDLKDIIREYKLKTGMTDTEIARRCDVARSTVVRWRNGSIRKVNSETLEKLNQLVGYNIEPIMRGMNTEVKLPVLGYVKAGYDLFAEENYLGEEDTSLDDAQKGDYYLKVTGDSMKGIGIMDGSLVLVHQTSAIENGDIAVVLIGDEVTVKKVLFKKHMVVLEAANPDVENRYFSSREVKETPIRFLGKVLSVKTYI